MMQRANVTNHIWTIDDFCTPEECAEWIAFAESHGFDEAPITTAAGPVMAKHVRDNTRVMVDDHVRAAALWERLREFVPSPLGDTEAIGLNERLRFYRYDVGQAFRWHLDGHFARANGECSRLTFMVYLNDDFRAGETEFRDAVVEPRTGRALLFVHQQLHQGNPVLSGRKYVLRSDVMYASP